MWRDVGTRGKGERMKRIKEGGASSSKSKKATKRPTPKKEELWGKSKFLGRTHDQKLQ